MLFRSTAATRLTETLAELASKCGSEGLVLFSGIARLNRSVLLLSLGRPDEADREARRSVADLRLAESDDGTLASALLVSASACFENGRWAECRDLLRQATGQSDAHADALGEAALIELFLGNIGAAETYSVLAAAQIGRAHV